MKAIDMTRREGGKDVALVELSSKRKQKYIVRTDLQPYQTEEADGVTFIEQHFDYKPTIDDVKDFVNGVIDAQTAENILSGYEWTMLHGEDEGKKVKVWLSKENQENFKAKHDAALNYPQLVTFPITYKVSENSDKTPIYEHFNTIEELAQFYLGEMNYIEQCLKNGWQKKDAVDWAPYENALAQL